MNKLKQDLIEAQLKVNPDIDDLSKSRMTFFHEAQASAINDFLFRVIPVPAKDGFVVGVVDGAYALVPLPTQTIVQTTTTTEVVDDHTHEPHSHTHNQYAPIDHTHLSLIHI